MRRLTEVQAKTWSTKQAWRWGWYECPLPLHALAQNESSPFACIPSSPAMIHASVRNFVDPPLRCFSLTSSSLVHHHHGKILRVSFSSAQSHARIQMRRKQFQEWDRRASHHLHANQHSHWHLCTYSKASCWICFREALRISDKTTRETLVPTNSRTQSFKGFKLTASRISLRGGKSSQE